MDETLQSNPVGFPAGLPIQSGNRLPFFKKGGSRPSAFVAEDMNSIVKVLNALLNAQVVALNGSNPTSANPNPTSRFVWSDTNLTLELYNVGGASTGGGAGISFLSFVSESDEYITCQDTNSNQYSVLKPYKLRKSSYDKLVINLPDGQHLYNWVSNSNGSSVYSGRTDTTNAPDGSGTEISKSIIWLPYLTGDIITVMTNAATGFIDGGGNVITMLDINVDARQWIIQQQICYNTATAYGLFSTPAYQNTL